MARRVAVVGSNKGIGLATVKNLCKKFVGDVILTARNPELGQKAVEILEKEGLHPKCHQLDIDDLTSIQKLRDYLKDNYGGLDVLVNNAGMAYPHKTTASVAEQAENTVRVNYFGTHMVCQELFPLLRPHARVVNVSSCMGMLSKIPSPQLREKLSSPDLTQVELSKLMAQFIEAAKQGVHAEQGWGNSTYVVSKVGVSALTFIQQREMDKDSREDIAINAVHPGYVDTDMTSHKGELTVEEGAKAPTYAALLPPGMESPRGKFI
ncbi:hypothetical protein LAZ67_1005299, partial [Cordylochernes scorpioides]